MTASTTLTHSAGQTMSPRRVRLVLGGAVALLVVSALISPFLGAGVITAIDLAQAFAARDWDSPAGALALHVRLPRIVLAALIGAALGVAGNLMQLLTRNPLASPQTLGINGCAALAMVLAIVVDVPWDAGVLPAFIGAALGGAFIAFLSVGLARGTIVLALAGLALHLLSTALIEAVTVLNDAAVDVVFWLNGSLAGAQWSDVRIAAPGILLGIVLTLVFTRQVQALALGREVVLSLGQNYAATTAGVIALVVVLAGSCVAVAGPIGFIGLMIPHVVRAVIGKNLRWELPLCAIGGACLLLLADAAARVVLWPSETPVGILTALVGAPVFLLLARRVIKERS